jgi:hypothetical protein
VASGDDSMDGPDPDRQAELAAVSIQAADGRKALLAFTGIDALVAWEPRARPVPATLDDVAATVLETGDDALLVDPAGPVPFVIGDDLIAQLETWGERRRAERARDAGRRRQDPWRPFVIWATTSSPSSADLRRESAREDVADAGTRGARRRRLRSLGLAGLVLCGPRSADPWRQARMVHRARSGG